MADLERVGVQLVAGGGPQFSATLARANQALSSVEKAATRSAASLNAFGQIATGALRRLGELGVNALVRAGRELLRFGARTLEAAAAGTPLERSIDRLQDRLLGITRFNLDPLFTQFDGLLTRATPAIEGFTNFFTRSFSSLAQNAIAYGENIGASLAQGLWNSLSFIVDALIGIGDAITSWLAPGSPPRLLPDLDTWGAEAANVWLEGWQRADFDVFQSLAGPIEALLRSAAPRGDAGLIPTILGTREAIAQAVEQARALGTVTEDSLNAIYAAAGAATPAMRAFLEATFNAELTSGALAEAQRELAEATAAYEALLQPIDDRLAAISEEQMQLTEEGRKSQLALILADPNATAAEKRMAALEIERIDAERARRAALAEGQAAVDTAQAKVDAAQTAHDQALDELAAKRELIELQTEQNTLIQEQLALMERLADLAAGGAGGAGPRAPAGGGRAGGAGGVVPVRPDFDLTDFIPQSLLDKLNELRTTWETTWDAILAKLQPVRDAWENDVKPAWDRLVAAITGSLPMIEGQIGRFVAFAVSMMGIQLPQVLDNLGKALDSLAGIWERHGDTIMSVIRVAFTLILTTISTTMLLVSGIIAVALRLIEGTFDTWALALEGDWDGVWENVKETLSDAWEIVKETITAALDGILLIVGQDLDEFLGNWEGVWDLVEIAVTEAFNKGKEVVDNFLSAVSGLWDWLQTHVFNFKLNLPELPDWAIPGSPTPFELGLRGIDRALQDLNNVRASPGGWGGLVSPPMSAGQVATSYAYSTVNNYNYNLGGVTTMQPAGNVIQSFETLRAMYGR